MNRQWVLPITLSLFLPLISSVPTRVSAEWSGNVAGSLFYTDDVALFSATRRLNLHGDPTQPALDNSLVGKGSDMVFEPDLLVMKSFDSSWGRTDISIKAQGFIFTINPEFNQASVGVEILHAFTPATKVRLRYYTAPDQLLGENVERRTGTNSIQEERVTSHIGSLRLEQRLAKDWEIRLLGRYGTRIYTDAFAQRNLNFWTIGPHVVWNFAEKARLVFGYHYERGLADGRNQPQFHDDTSYINNYLTLGLEAELTTKLSCEIGLHYEVNNWTSNLAGDERNGARESVVQGEATARYRVNDRFGLRMGFQRSQRTQSFEEQSVFNTNVAVGAEYQF